MDAIENKLKTFVTKNNTPSVQYILFNQNTILKSYCLGLANIKSNKKVDPATTYNAFSVTKTFTALAVLQLAEQQNLNIDDPARNYLPDLPYSKAITIQQLLSHSAGVPNPIPLSWIHLKSEHAQFDRDEFFKPIFQKYNKSKSGPNQKFSYSNLGYVLLGQLIERVSGLSYENYIDEHIIKRLDLTTRDLGFGIIDAQNHATGYHKKLDFFNFISGFFFDKSKFTGKSEGKWKPYSYYYVNGTPHGGLIGTARAFVKYLQALLKPDCSLISANYKKQLFLENHTNNNKPTGMCLSWFCGQLNGKKYFAHAGGGGGYYCEIRIYPDIQMGSVIFFNRTGMTDARILDEVDKVYFKIHMP